MPFIDVSSPTAFIDDSAVDDGTVDDGAVAGLMLELVVVTT